MTTFDNVAARLKELLPNRPDGKTITAWSEAAKAWNRQAERIRALEERVARLEGSPPPPDPDPEPEPEPEPTPQLAPQTYNKGSAGQDARYCTAGLGKDSTGAYIDAGGYRYDENGLSLGGRSGNDVPGLKPADMMDDKTACDPYEWQGRQFPPWPAESYLR